MYYIYGCQSVHRNANGFLEHQPPIVCVSGDAVIRASKLCINGPSQFGCAEVASEGEQFDTRPPEVRRCRDHGHTLWLETEAPFSDKYAGHLNLPKRIWICHTVCKAPKDYKQGPIVFDSEDGQKTARLIRLAGTCEVIFDEHNPVIGYCPCGQTHSHRLWITTEDAIEVVVP